MYDANRVKCVHTHRGSLSKLSMTFDTRNTRPSGRVPALMLDVSSVMFVLYGPCHVLPGDVLKLDHRV